MQKNKTAWNEPYKIATALDKGETIKRLESKIGFKNHWHSGLDRPYLFYGIKTGDGKYSVYIASHLMHNPLLPKVVIEVFADSYGKGIVLFRVKPIYQALNFMLLFGTVIFISERLPVLLYAVCLCLGAFLHINDWGYVRQCVGKWLEELMDVRRETEG